MLWLTLASLSRFIDGEALAAHLAQPDLFWVAEQYLDIPAELAPPTEDDGAGIPESYLANRNRWRASEPPQRTIGEFLSLKRGLRHATFNHETRGDLPLWLRLMRTLDDPAAHIAVRQRARYEVAVATLRGTGDMRPADGLVEHFFSDLLQDRPHSVARVVDATTLLTYAFGAALHGTTALGAEKLVGWNEQLRAIVDENFEQAPSRNTRAILLRTLGQLYFHPDLADIELPEEPLPAPDPADGEAAFSSDVVAWGGAPVISLPHAMSSWLELARLLEDAPLFPVDSFARQLGVLTSVLVDHPDWAELTELVDAALVIASGQAAAADRCRDRAVKLREAGRLRHAVHELHRAKIDWWSGDTFRGSLLTMLLIADCYQQMNLPYAAKFYALAVCAGVARHEEESVDLMPSALIAAGDADYLAGAWCGAAELYELACFAAASFWEGDPDDHDSVLRSIVHLSWIHAAARTLVPAALPQLEASVGRTGVNAYLDEVRDVVPALTRLDWERIGDEDLLGRPFSDAGHERIIRFAALGTRWTIRSSTERADSFIAERLAAAAQILLVELADVELCLLPTDVTVEVSAAAAPDGPAMERPGPEYPWWRAQLTAWDASAPDRADDVLDELLAVIVALTRGASLASDDQVEDALARAMRRGLTHKLATGHVYDDLVQLVLPDDNEEIQRSVAEPDIDKTSGTIRESPELPWPAGLGPTYDQARSYEMIRRRYDVVPTLMVRTLPRLRNDPAWQRLVVRLRDRGWRDWQILTAAHNVTINEARFLSRRSVVSRADREREERRASEPEGPWADTVPLSAYHENALDRARRLAMMASLQGWDLQLNQPVADPEAVESFLVARYAYWTDDVEHDDPFETHDAFAGADAPPAPQARGRGDGGSSSE